MKRLVVCADGTWNRPDRRDRERPRRDRYGRWIRKPSNVVKLARAVKAVSKMQIPQIVFYDPGVGTGWGILDPLLGGLAGRGLSENIVDAYRFLVLNYEPGDELYLFGFSRGAYTVRSLAGLLGACGVLPKDEAYYIPDAYLCYRSRDQVQLERFRKDHKTQEVMIKVLGVWDTVGSLGVPFGGPLFRRFNRKYEFHNVTLGHNVDNAFHALAIDERRSPFRPALWDKKVRKDQNMEQVWFSGVHCNVGGGYDKDGLANCAFQWMLEKAHLGGEGLDFDHRYADHYASFASDELRDSAAWYYKLFGLNKHVRPIGEMADGHEEVSWSAMERLEADPPQENGGKYRPSNLLDYLKRLGRPVPG